MFLMLGLALVAVANCEVFDKEVELWIFGGQVAGPGARRSSSVHSLTLGGINDTTANWVQHQDLWFKKVHPAVIRRQADGWIYVIDPQSAEKINPMATGDDLIWTHGEEGSILGSDDGPFIVSETSNGTILVYHAGNTFDDILRNYDPVSQKYAKNTPSMPQPLRKQQYRGCGAMIEDKLYVVGGKLFVDYSNTKIVQIYDFQKNQWSVAENETTFEHDDCGAAVLDGKLYVCGGKFRSRAHSKCESMDPSTGEWTEIGSMNRNRCAFSMVSHAGKLIAVGGVEQRAIEVYDTLSNKWTLLSQTLPGNQEYGVGAVVVEKNETDFKN